MEVDDKKKKKVELNNGDTEKVAEAFGIGADWDDAGEGDIGEISTSRKDWLPVDHL